MDRGSFLRAQPYLYPLERSAPWPPPLPAETEDRSSCRRETLLRDFSLSIESLPSCSSTHENGASLSQQSMILSSGPAFFVRVSQSSNHQAETIPTNPSTGTIVSNDDSFDPAMCPLELAVQSATLTLPPWTPHGGENLPLSFSNRFTSPSAYQKILRRQQATYPQKQSTPQIQESTIFLRLDGHAYQMDLSCIENIELEEGDEHASRPPSLMIQFGTVCIFRIFSAKKDPSSAAQLKTVQTLLIRLLTANGQIPSEFPVRYPFLASPAGSSTTAFSSMNEPGQGEFSRPQQQQTPTHSGRLLVHDSPSKSLNTSSSPLNGSNPQYANNSEQSAQTAGTERGQSSSEQPGKREAPSSSEVDPLFITRKRQAAFIQASSNLSTLEQLVLRPETGNDPKRLRAMNVQKAVELMNAIPENLAASYGPHSQLETVFQHQNERIHEYEVQMNDLIHSFWPGTRKSFDGGGGSLSRGQAATLLDRPAAAAPPPPPQSDHTAEACIEKANRILAQHKAAILEKLAVSLLPSRG